MIIFQVKSRYKILKLSFKISIYDFLIFITNLDFLFWNQYQKYIIVFEKAKNNISIILKGEIL